MMLFLFPFVLFIVKELSVLVWDLLVYFLRVTNTGSIFGKQRDDLNLATPRTEPECSLSLCP